MTIEQIVTIMVSVFGGGFAIKLFDIIRDARAGHLQKRRAEVDRAIQERDAAIADRNTARAEEAWWARWSRLLEESLAIHRRRWIDRHGDTDLPPYPNRPDKE